ncbi:receptor-like serine/threonine-protein kinase ALE2-like protein, partial [Trifolium pratense]
MIESGIHEKTVEIPTGLSYVLSGGAPIVTLSPDNPPSYSPFINPSQPPKSSHFSIPFKKRGEWKLPISGFKNIAPIHSTEAAVPSALTQPPLTHHASNCCKQDMVLKRGSKGCHCVYPIKLDIRLLNVSQNPDWDKFLEEFATQLGLQNNTQIDLINFYVVNQSTYNISMDITPHKGISFSASEASKINSSLLMNKVRLDPGLVGGYKLLNLIWFEPPPPTQ